MSPLQIDFENEKLRLVVLGTGVLGINLLRGIIERPELAQIVGFLPVSNIPRHFSLEEHPVQQKLLQYARRQGVHILDCPGANSIGFRQELDSLRPHIVLVGGWPEILKASVLNSEGTVFVNCHGSKLPKYRGACPHIASIFYGDCQTAITFHLIDAGIDTGDILFQKDVPIEEEETALALSARMAELFGESIGTLLSKIISGRTIPRKQFGEASYIPTANPWWGWIQWHSSPEFIDQRMRALYGYLPMFTSLNGMVIGFEKGRVVSAQDGPRDWTIKQSTGDRCRMTPGTVISSELDKLTVATRDPDFLVELNKPVIYPSTKGSEVYQDIVPGHQLISRKCGSILRGPSDVAEVLRHETES